MITQQCQECGMVSYELLILMSRPTVVVKRWQLNAAQLMYQHVGGIYALLLCISLNLFEQNTNLYANNFRFSGVHQQWINRRSIGPERVRTTYVHDNQS